MILSIYKLGPSLIICGLLYMQSISVLSCDTEWRSLSHEIRVCGRKMLHYLSSVEWMFAMFNIVKFYFPHELFKNPQLSSFSFFTVDRLKSQSFYYFSGEVLFFFPAEVTPVNSKWTDINLGKIWHSYQCRHKELTGSYSPVLVGHW